MAVLKVIEVMSSSNKSWEDAALNAVKRSSKTVKNIRSVWIKDPKHDTDQNRQTKRISHHLQNLF